MAHASLSHIDDIPALDADDERPVRGVRQHFGITSFGAASYTGVGVGDRIISEHTEAEDEELYVVASGRARFELDGEQHDAPAGTLVYAPPAAKRTAFAEEPNTTVLVVGARPGKAFTPIGWEIWYPLRNLYTAGEYDTVAARLRELIDANPGYGILHFNLACVESLRGQKAAALEHLRTAFELNGDQFRGLAKVDTDLDAIRDEPGFADIVGD
jgi:tetratricopeptide (TPR) repeat protein